MPKSKEHLRLKDRILEHISVAVKQIQEFQISEGKERIELANEDWQIQDFLKHIDHALLHGLRHVTKGYWLVVKEFTHRDSVIELQRLVNVTTNIGRGRAWLYLAMNEGLLESYMRCFADNLPIVMKRYVANALVLDTERLETLKMLVSGLDFVKFKMNVDVAYLDISCHLPLKDREDSGSDRLSLSSMGSVVSEISHFPVNDVHILPEDHTQVAQVKGEHSDSGSDNLYPINSENNRITFNSPEVDDTVPNTKTRTFGIFRADQVESSSLNEDDDNDHLVIRVKAKGAKKKARKTPVTSVKQNKEDDIISTTHEKIVGISESDAMSMLYHHQPEVPNNPSSTPHVINDEHLDDLSVELSKSHIEESVWQTIVKQSKEARLSLAEELAEASQDIVRRSDQVSRSSTESVQDIHNIITEQSKTTLPPKDSDSSTQYSTCDNVVVEKTNIQDNEIIQTETYDHDTDIPSVEQTDSVDHTETCYEIVDEQSSMTTDMSAVNPPETNQSFDDIYSTEKLQDGHAEESEGKNDISTATHDTSKTSLNEQTDDLLKDTEALRGEVKVDNNMLLQLMLEIFQSENEKFVMMYRTRTGHTEGSIQNVFVVLTDHALYVLTKGTWGSHFTKDSMITYQEIDYISLSINYQVLQIVCTNRRKQLWLTTGSETVTRAITSTLDKIIGECDGKLSVLTDATAQKIGLKKWAAQECQCQSNEVELQVYSLVHWEDTDMTSSKGIVREGELMFRHKTQYKTSPWRTSYFIIKDGTLLQFADRFDKVPQLSIQLFNEDCSGCRRCTIPNQANCFEIIYSNNTSIQLSASAMADVNDWLLCLCQAVSEGQQLPQSSVNGFPCCLVMTQSMIFLCHEDLQSNFFRTLGSASITDVTGVTIDPMVDTFCIVEFESTDEHVSSSQWVLYFNAALEREKFLDPLALLWDSKFRIPIPINLIEDVKLQKQCRTKTASILEL